VSSLRPGYMAYLLRLWQVDEGEGMTWRATLESPHTGERRGFASLADLFSFLASEVCRDAEERLAPSAGGKGGQIEG
jgi:hypothetical protein